MGLDRPATLERPLHLEQSLTVVNPDSCLPLRRAEPPAEGYTPLIGCPYFTLTLLHAERQPLRLAPRGETFHALTLTAGAAELRGDGWSLPLATYATAVVPAAAYELVAAPGGCTALRQYFPDQRTGVTQPIVRPHAWTARAWAAATLNMARY